MGFGDLFKPKYEHSNPEVRKNAIKKIKDKQLLIKLANDDDTEVVVTVFNQLTILNSEDYILKEAIENMRNCKALTILYENASMGIARAISSRLGELTKLINDKQKLTKLANHVCGDVREVVVEKISDEAILTDLAQNDSNWRVRQIAVRKISDEAILTDIAQNDANSGVRQIAVRKISDEAVLTDIAKNDPACTVSGSYKVRDAALERLRKLNTNSTTYISPEKVSRINDQSKLINIAQNAADYSSRKEAVWKINDESVLADVAQNDSESDVRLVAVRRINDESVLINVAQNEGNHKVRQVAVEKINDVSVLADIAKNDPYCIRYPGGFNPANDRGPEPPSTEYPIREAAKNRLRNIQREK